MLMEDMNKNVEVLTSETVLKNDNMVKLSKPYKFEGKEYSEIDLSGLEDLTAADMIKANKILERAGTMSVLPEMSLEYACVLAARASSQPIEFFNGLHPRDAIKVKNKVTGFLFGQE